MKKQVKMRLTASTTLRKEEYWEATLEWPTPGRDRYRYQKVTAITTIGFRATPCFLDLHCQDNKWNALHPHMKLQSHDYSLEHLDRNLSAFSQGVFKKREQKSGKCAYTLFLLSEPSSGASSQHNLNQGMLGKEGFTFTILEGKMDRC